MNLEDLRAVQDDERRSDSLQSLPDSFYRDVAEYVAGLREERERAAAAADDPFSSDEVRQLTDEIETAEEVVEAIYERRVGKVVKRASLAAAGMAADDEGLTVEETTLFEQLVERIEANRRDVLDVIEGETDPTTDDGSTPADTSSTADASLSDDEAAPDAAFDATDAMGGDAGIETAEPDEGTDGATTSESDPAPDGGATPAGATGESTPGATDADRVTVRITRDVGEIYGVDERVYDLASEDVVSLPADNAEPLVERDAAQRL